VLLTVNNKTSAAFAEMNFKNFSYGEQTVAPEI